MNNQTLEDRVQSAQSKVIKNIKNRMFDIIAVFLIIAMLALHLGVLELRDVTLSGLINIFLECVPFFLTSVLLAINFYTKGTFSGKATNAYTTAITVYSEKIDAISGLRLSMLTDFCQEYNDKALENIQTSILKTVSISFEIFDKGQIIDDKQIAPLKALSKTELLKLYSKERVRVIIKAKKAKIKGLTDNILLSDNDSKDITDTGYTEKQLSSKKTVKSAVTYLLCTLFLALIGIKDILQWGWIGLLIVVFKLIYILCSSYMNYFTGYNDITIFVVNHIGRKIDILKQFFAWSDAKMTNCNN